MYDALKGPFLSGAFRQQASEALSALVAECRVDPSFISESFEELCDDFQLPPGDSSYDELLDNMENCDAIELFGPYVPFAELFSMIAQRHSVMARNMNTAIHEHNSIRARVGLANFSRMEHDGEKLLNVRMVRFHVHCARAGPVRHIIS